MAPSSNIHSALNFININNSSIIRIAAGQKFNVGDQVYDISQGGKEAIVKHIYAPDAICSDYEYNVQYSDSLACAIVKEVNLTCFKPGLGAAISPWTEPSPIQLQYGIKPECTCGAKYDRHAPDQHYSWCDANPKTWWDKP